MKYHGKRYLYNFLKERYDVDTILKDYRDKTQMKDLKYDKFRGSEWLKSIFEEIHVYSPCRGVIFVTLNKIDDETCKKSQLEYSKYVDGVLDYQTKNGKCTIMWGVPYHKVTI